MPWWASSLKTDPLSEAAYLAHIKADLLHKTRTYHRASSNRRPTCSNCAKLQMVSSSGSTPYIFFKKCSQRLYLLRRLSGLGVSQQILELVYRSLVESVFTIHLPAWYCHLNCRNKNKLSRVVVSMANKICEDKEYLGR